MLADRYNPQYGWNAQQYRIRERHWDDMADKSRVVPDLEQDFRDKARYLQPRADYAEGMFRLTGLLGRVLGAPAGTLITGLDVYTSLQSGERAGKVFVEAGIGTAVGIGGGIAVTVTIAGAPVLLIVGALAAVALASTTLAWGAGKAYEKFVPATAHEKLIEYGGGDYERRASIYPESPGS